MTQIENDIDSMITILYTIRGRICNNYTLLHAGILSEMEYFWFRIGLVLAVLTVKWRTLIYSLGRPGKKFVSLKSGVRE